MEMKVDTGGIEDLSGKIRNAGSIIEDVSSLYRTNNYEILCDMETEFADELKIEMEEISNQIDNCCFLLKKHENFLLNSIQEYESTEKDTVRSCLMIENNLLRWTNTGNSGIVDDKVYNLPILYGKLNNDIFNILPIIPIPYRSFELTGIVDLEDINLIIGGYNQSSFSIGFDSCFKILAGITASVASNALITPIGKIVSILIGKLNGFDSSAYTSGNSSTGGLGSSDDMQIGSAKQINYNYTEFADIEGVIKRLTEQTAPIGAGNGAAAVFAVSSVKAQDGEERNSSDDENKDKDEEKTHYDSTNDKTVSQKETVYNNDYLHKAGAADGEEDNGEYGHNNGLSYGSVYTSDSQNDRDIYNNTAAKDVDNQGYSSAFAPAHNTEACKDDRTGSNINFSNIQNQSSDIPYEMENNNAANYEKNNFASDNTAANGTRVISDGEMGFSIYTHSDKAESGSLYNGGVFASGDNEIENSERWASYKDASIAYEKILLKNAQKSNTNGGNLGNAALGLTAAGTVGGSAAGLGIMSGTTASGTANVVNTAEKAVSAAMSFVIGMGEFDNLFDFVGKASRCNIRWLSEITNILADKVNPLHT